MYVEIPERLRSDISSPDFKRWRSIRIDAFNKRVAERVNWQWWRKLGKGDKRVFIRIYGSAENAVRNRMNMVRNFECGYYRTIGNVMQII